MSHEEEYLPTNQRKPKMFTENEKIYCYVDGIKYRVITESVIKKEKEEKHES